MKFFAKKTLRGLVLAVASLSVLPGSEISVAQVRDLYRIEIPPGETLKSFFRYTPGRIPFVSTHRGGVRRGFPENSIATFENTLRNTWSILEIDPRYTKDSVIILMHDATLERTSTGTGKVADHTFEQIRKLRLKDVNGDVTKENIPTLDEAIRWARNKTVLVVDQKDVPVEARVKKIQEHRAQSWVALIVYSLEDAKKCYSLDPDIVMELMVPDKKAMSDIENAGIPWQNVVAFVTHTTPKDAGIFRELHDKGVMCIRGSSRTIDKEYTEGKITGRKALFERYREMVASGTDIIEADLGIEAGEALRKPIKKNSGKSQFFVR